MYQTKVGAFTLLLTVLRFWKELPELFGRLWPEIRSHLLGLIAQYQASTSDQEREHKAMDVMVLLRQNPEARKALQALYQTAMEQGALHPVFSYLDLPITRFSFKLETPGEGNMEMPSDDEKIKEEILALANKVRPSPRFTNLAILDQEQRVVEPNTDLRPAVTYMLRLNIGSLRTDSLIKNPAPIPDEKLPPSKDGYWLEAWVHGVTGIDFEKSLHAFFLPVQGASWTCGCEPGKEHHCTPEQRSAFLLAPFRTSTATGAALEARVMIYHKKNLLQGYKLFQPDSASGAMNSEVSVTQEVNLTGWQKLDLTESRDLNIFTVSAASGGASELYLNGAREPLNITLGEGQMAASVGAARFALRSAHIRETNTWWGKTQLTNLYDADYAKPLEQFIADLTALAPLGFTLSTLVLQNSDRWDSLKKPGNIQVCRASGSAIIFPWALIYDIPLEPGAPYKPCTVLRDWPKALDREPERARSCPYEHEHELNTLCPYGFWGFRHYIEQPSSVEVGAEPPRWVELSSNSPAMVVGRSHNLDRGLSEAHLKKLGEARDCDSLEKMRDAFRNRIEILYFYTHGRRRSLPGTTQQALYLELGAEPFEPEHIAAWRRSTARQMMEQWKGIAPLVFINGCHTAELTPELLVSFVDVFAIAGAGGVIGTEITLEQGMAGMIAEQFFAAFLQAHTVAQALLRVRQYLLRRGNALGLAYTPFCSSHLALSTGKGFQKFNTSSYEYQ